LTAGVKMSGRAKAFATPLITLCRNYS
ncbi:hypothetical protein, partial [Klebsiella pneumoniae]